MSFPCGGGGRRSVWLCGCRLLTAYEVQWRPVTTSMKAKIAQSWADSCPNLASLKLSLTKYCTRHVPTLGPHRNIFQYPSTQYFFATKHSHFPCLIIRVSHLRGLFRAVGLEREVADYGQPDSSNCQEGTRRHRQQLGHA